MPNDDHKKMVMEPGQEGSATSIVESKPSLSRKSLLRYPGGKFRAVASILEYMPATLDELLSPFFGGGSVELHFAAQGTRVLGYDIFMPLVEFWQCVLKQPAALADAVAKYHPLSKPQFFLLRDMQTTLDTKLQRAAVYYVLNRSSFSGSTLSGGMSPGHDRFTLTSIKRLRQFHNPNFSVEKLDFKESLKKHPYIFAYLDPPYLTKRTLYGEKGNKHKNFDHEGLAEILTNRSRWLLSYNDNDEIRELYAGHHIIVPNWKYGMSNNKISKEILIFSKDYKLAEEVVL